MQPFELGAGLLAACVGLGLLARRLGLPYPILLVVAGLLVSHTPGLPRFALSPDVVLYLFLPPLLYAGAFNTPWSAFRSQLRSILLLAVGLVVFTTVAVAFVAHEFAGLSWPAAFVLGAIVSPPDAVAAAAVTRQVQVPEAVTTILEGESLVNDGSALVLYRIGLAWAAGGVLSVTDAVGQFVIVAAGGIGIGLAAGWLVVRFHKWATRHDLMDAKLTIAATLLTPFAIYFPAEHLHVSGVLAVVAAGMWVGSRCEEIFPEEMCGEARSVWETVEFLLNSVVFVMIGLQLPFVLDAMGGELSPLGMFIAAAAVSAATILARLVWMFPGAYLPRLFDRYVLGREVVFPPWQSVTVVGWAGMRGVVSLAAAMAIPTAVPERGTIQFVTFWVIFATLVGQGLTLPKLIRVLSVRPGPTEVNAEDPKG